MGRRKKYMTEEQQIEARKKRQMDYYWKNQDKINKKNLERYHRNNP
jgi:hypothetical protein